MRSMLQNARSVFGVLSSWWHRHRVWACVHASQRGDVAGEDTARDDSRSAAFRTSR
jgi:hypothetical protein